VKRGGRILGAALLVSMVGCQSAANHQVGPWFDRNGSPVLNGYMGARLVLSVEFGSEHCNWQDTAFMYMVWPLDRPAPSNDYDRVRAYVWQTNAAFAPESLTSEPRVVPQMPADARRTGFHRGKWELWISRAHLDEAVFVTDGDIIQSWAYSKHLPACI
jgi:hypothetical protein